MNKSLTTVSTSISIIRSVFGLEPAKLSRVCSTVYTSKLVIVPLLCRNLLPAEVCLSALYQTMQPHFIAIPGNTRETEIGKKKEK